MQAYTVASGIIFDAGRVAFVQNRRKNGSLDWSTPGGVVDPGEGVLEALQREVIEETALDVTSWSPMLYSVDVDFIGRELTLHAEVFAAAGFAGELTIDDPDDVVVDGRWVERVEAHRLLDTSPRWVAEPLRHALTRLVPLEPAPSAPPASTLESVAWRYNATRTDGAFVVELLSGPEPRR